MTDPTTPIDLDGWLARLAGLLPAEVVAEAGPAERAALLDLARIAARGAERTAAPITTYIAGVALAGLPRDERLARLRSLIEALQA